MPFTRWDMWSLGRDQKQATAKSPRVATFSLVKSITQRSLKDDEAKQTLERSPLILMHRHTSLWRQSPPLTPGCSWRGMDDTRCWLWRTWRWNCWHPAARRGISPHSSGHLWSDDISHIGLGPERRMEGRKRRRRTGSEWSQRGGGRGIAISKMEGVSTGRERCMMGKEGWAGKQSETGFKETRSRRGTASGTESNSNCRTILTVKQRAARVRASETRTGVDDQQVCVHAHEPPVI